MEADKDEAASWEIYTALSKVEKFDWQLLTNLRYSFSFMLLISNCSFSIWVRTWRCRPMSFNFLNASWMAPLGSLSPICTEIWWYIYHLIKEQQHRTRINIWASCNRSSYALPEVCPRQLGNVGLHLNLPLDFHRSLSFKSILWVLQTCSQLRKVSCEVSPLCDF